MGRKAYSAAEQLLITANAGGSNGVRVRLWKVELQKSPTKRRQGDRPRTRGCFAQTGQIPRGVELFHPSHIPSINWNTYFVTMS